MATRKLTTDCSSLLLAALSSNLPNYMSWSFGMLGGWSYDGIKLH
jgi:hypothetical protein